jgi:Mg2+ and Co2+ transporter CorA
VDIGTSQVAIAALGALAALVPGGIFAALRYHREDDGAVVDQAATITDSAIDVITALRTELQHTRNDLAFERDERRSMALEVRTLRAELSATNRTLNLTRATVESCRDEVVTLRRTLAARGDGDGQ